MLVALLEMLRDWHYTKLTTELWTGCSFSGKSVSLSSPEPLTLCVVFFMIMKCFDGKIF